MLKRIGESGTWLLSEAKLAEFEATLKNRNEKRVLFSSCGGGVDSQQIYRLSGLHQSLCLSVWTRQALTIRASSFYLTFGMTSLASPSGILCGMLNALVGPVGVPVPALKYQLPCNSSVQHLTGERPFKGRVPSSLALCVNIAVVILPLDFE